MRNKFFLILLIVLITGAFIRQRIYLPKDFSLVETKLFSVEKNQSFFQIAENLEKQGFIKDKIFFKIYVILKNQIRNLQAGEYFLSPAMTIPQITKKIVLGDVARFTIIIPEGFNAEQIYQELKNITNVTKSGLAAHEGYLFPDTYDVIYGMTEEKVIKMMTDNFNKKTGNLKITSEIIIMASLLEKEVRTKQDKKLVSGILWKRLKTAMPLQVDATIAYILREDDWTFEQMLKEIGMARTIDSPYNTYLHLGLPPGPISNPGLESIIAAIDPKESDFWFYLSTPEGETIFSKTLKEHNIAKAKYLR